MKFKEYIETHQVFTVDDLLSVVSKASVKTLLRRALDSGEIERARRGLYVSRTGKFRGESPDPFCVLAAVDKDAVISYHSALVAHGVAHSVSFECAFRSQVIRTPFEYGGVRYIPYDDGDSPLTQTVRARAFGSISATTREQTLVDCFARPSRSGGTEEVVRSCSAFPYVDTETLTTLLRDVPVATVARTGWLLEAKAAGWSISETELMELESLLGRGPVKLDPASKENRGWNKRWNLYLPDEEEEVFSWIS